MVYFSAPISPDTTTLFTYLPLVMSNHRMCCSWINHKCVVFAIYLIVCVCGHLHVGFCCICASRWCFLLFLLGVVTFLTCRLFLFVCQCASRCWLLPLLETRLASAGLLACGLICVSPFTAALNPMSIFSTSKADISSSVSTSSSSTMVPSSTPMSTWQPSGSLCHLSCLFSSDFLWFSQHVIQ